MTTFFTALVCLSLGFAIGRWRQGLEENRGEAAVRRTLSACFPSPSHHLLNNVTLRTDDGTTQVDHVLVSRSGVFVLESKHYTGWLFANAGSPQWTQVLYKNHYKFQNPIHQNRKHVSTVAKLLNFLESDQIHSVVVFTGDATFKTERPAGVVSLSELEAYLRTFDAEVLSENRLQFCVGRLECHRMALTRQTDVEHVAHLRRRFGDTP
jgi:restriction system protein